MPYQVRPPGVFAVTTCRHVTPSNSQVWSMDGPPNGAVLPPPYITVRPRRLSNTRPMPARADGDVVGASCVQALPSNDQVWLKLLKPVVAAPPNRIVRLANESKVMPGIKRAAGDAAGVTWCHCAAAAAASGRTEIRRSA